MRQIIVTIWISSFLIGFSNDLRASDKLKVDSIKITKIINEFYNWYFTSIKENNYSDYRPRFIESKNGMTTLDYSKYLENLKIHGFSDALILKEKQSYSDCMFNLRQVKYSKFQKTTFTNLDEYKQTNCDFGNYYRWSGGQEPINGIRINKIKFISSDLVEVTINYFENDTLENKKYNWGENRLTLIKIDNVWLINKIDSWERIKNE